MKTKAVQDFLDYQTNNGTEKAYKKSVSMFIQYLTEKLEYPVTGDEIIARRRIDVKSETYEMENTIMLFKQWAKLQPLESNPDETVSERTAVNWRVGVRAFFAYHRLDLKLRRMENKKLQSAVARTEKYKFSTEDLEKMDKYGDVTEKYVIRVGKSLGLRYIDFRRLKRGDVEPYINRPAPVCIGPYMTVKEHVNAYPFLDNDAIEIIKLRLEEMNHKGKTKPSDRLFTQNPKQLSRILRKLCDLAGINTGDKQVKFHCLRAFLCDKLAGYMSESKWKQIVGKKISEGAYVGPDELQKDFQRAMPDFQLTKAQNQENIEQLVKLQILKNQAKDLGLDIEKVFRLRNTVSVPEQIEVLEYITSENQTVGAVC